MEVVKIENVTRTFVIGKVETRALRGSQPLYRERRVHRPGRSIWLWKDDPAADDWLP